MQETFISYHRLLEDFKKLPIVEQSPTFMEICKYPRSRFEEVCSRILQFFLDPKAEHKLGNLWLSALLDMIGYTPFSYNINDTTVDTEEYAEGKRIDITIKNKEFVIAIENKTTADLYNPLDIYKHYIEEKYAQQEHRLIVLSVKPFNDYHSKKWIADNDFKAFTYQNLFAAVNSRLGEYITHCDQKYLSYMLDFMKTINNMENENTKVEYDFFFKNEKTINEIIERYNSFQQNITKKHIEEIENIKTYISKETNRDWWAWQGWDLGIKFNEQSECIGIEASFTATKNGVFDEFHIYITTWKKKDWIPYKEAVLAEFKEQIYLDERTDGRVYLHLPIIYNNDTELIVKTLKNTYDRLEQIVKEHQKNI